MQCDIHLAHGQLEHTIDHGLGIFDLSCASSSHGFAQALRRICVQLMPEMEHAQARVSRTLETLSESRNKAWRSDLYVNEGGSDSFTRIVQWRAHCKWVFLPVLLSYVLSTFAAVLSRR